MKHLILIGLIGTFLTACDGDEEPVGTVGSGRGAEPEPAPSAEDDFEQRYIAELNRQLPSARVERRPDGILEIRAAADEAPAEANLTTAREECARAPGNCDRTLEWHVRSIVRLLTADPDAPPELARVRMVLQGEANIREQVPQMLEASWPFAGDLRWHFVEDQHESIAALSPTDLERLGEDRDGLRERALANMREAFGPLRSIPLPDAPGVFAVDTSANGLASDSYDNARLIDHAAWREVAGRLEGQLIAAAPARDHCIFADDAVPGALERLRFLAGAMSERELHPISPQLVRWTPEGWVAL